MNLLSVSALLGALMMVRGQDPTTICYPAAFQTLYYNFLTEDKGIIYADFAKELWAEVSLVSNTRILHDFANLRSYSISGQGNDTECKSYRLQQNHVMLKCLPPYAKLVYDASGYLHYVSGRLSTQTWEISTGYDTTFRIVLALIGSAYFPVLSQEYGFHGTKEMVMYINSTGTMNRPEYHSIPSDCNFANLRLPPVVG